MYNKIRRFLAMMLTVLLTVSGAASQFVLTAFAAEEMEPLYEGRNIQISSAGDVVNLTDGYLEKLGALETGTISVRYRSTASQGLSALFSLSSTKSGEENTYAVAYVNPAGGKVGVEVRSTNPATNYNQVNVGADIQDQEWHTVTYVFGASVFQIYVDGKKAAEESKNGFFSKISNANSVKVGALDRAGKGENQWLFSGDIDQVAVYDKALGEEEILELQAATTYEKQIPDDPADASRTDQRLFYNGYANSAAYRIPSLLTTKNGVIIAGIDKRQSGSGDSGNIDTVVRRSLDGGKTWKDSQTLINLPDGAQRKALTIDSSMVQDRESGRVFLFVDMFPESNALMDSRTLVAGSGYKTVDGKRYFILRDYENSVTSNNYKKEYTIRENGIVWDEDTSQPTEYRVPDLTAGNLYKETAGVQEDCRNIFLYTGENAGELKAARTCYLWMVYSDDDGETWSKPQDLSGMIKAEWMVFSGTGPGVGTQMSNGRLIVPVYVTNTNVGASQSAAVIYSDDNGETWKMGETVNDGIVNGGAEHMTSGAMMTESQAVEVTLADGSKALKLFCRNRSGRVKIATSYDGGVTWEDELVQDPVLKDQYCQMTIVPYPYEVAGYEGKQMFLFANPDNTASRSRGTLRLGYYDPESDSFVWVASRLIDSGSYAYSCLSVVKENEIAVLWEGTNLDINYTTVNLQWLRADKTPAPRPNPTVKAVGWEGGKIAITFDQPIIAVGTPVLEGTVDKADAVSMNYASGSGTDTILFDTDLDNTHSFTFSGVKTEGGAFIGNSANGFVGEGAFDGFSIAAETIPEIKDVKALAGYGSIQISFTPAQGVSTYDIYRSELKNGAYTKIGSVTDTNHYTDRTGTGKRYWYKIQSQDGNLVSASTGSDIETGMKALQKNAELFEQFADPVFDGTRVVNLSDKAEALKSLESGSVIFKFKTTAAKKEAILLMGKKAGEAYAQNKKADFLLETSGSGRYFRADFAHTRAAARQGSSLSDGEWHTAIYSSEKGGKTMRFTVDGVELWSNTVATNGGIFNTLPAFDELTVGGYYGADGNPVTAKCFDGEIAYVAVTSECFTDAEAIEISGIQAPEITSVVPKYSSITVNFSGNEEDGSYDIYRSESENGPFEKIGSSNTGSYTDQTGAGKTYFYQVMTQDGLATSDSVSNKKATGIESMKENAVLYKDVKDVVFDGNTVVDVSEKASEIGGLNKGSIMIRFKTTDHPGQHAAMFVGKTKGETVQVYGSYNKAAVLLEGFGSQMRFRTDFAHTRASIQNSDFADGEWHTAMVINDTTAQNTLRFTIDGKELAKFPAGNNNANVGFFSTVKNLDQLTIGGFKNGESDEIVNGFTGQIAYVMVTDEVVTTEEANEITRKENGLISDISTAMFDDSKDNTWVFAGGKDVAGGYEETQGIRNYMGQFEEYVRWTKSGNVNGRQRYTINNGKEGRTLKEISESFDSLVRTYDPKALAVLVGREEWQNGTEGVESFKAVLTALVDQAMSLRDNTGYFVIQTPYAQKDEQANEKAQAYAAAVQEVFEGLTEAQKTKVVVVNHFTQTNKDTFKDQCLDTEGNLNAYGHLEIAREFSKVVYGSDDNFPVNDSSLSLVPVSVPSVYPEEIPEVTAKAQSLELTIPETVTGLADSWSYELTIDGQKISGDFSENHAVIQGLKEGTDYVLTVTSKNGNVRLQQVQGTITEGDKAFVVSSRQTNLTEQQEKVHDLIASEEPKTWMFVGDSITHGALHTNGYDSIHQTFEKFLRDELGRTDDVVINTAVSGATSREQEANSNERLDKYDADVVIVMLGTNDASNSIVPLEEYRSNLNSIVTKIKNKGAIPVLRTPNPLRSNDSRATNLPKYAEVIREVAAQQNVILADHFAEWTKELETRAYLWNNGWWNNDAIHPNPNGQMNMTQSLIRALGLFDTASPICNLSYEMPHTDGTSQLLPELTVQKDTISLDVSKLQESFGADNVFGKVTMKAESQGVAYEAEISGNTGILTLKNLPLDASYQVSVSVELKNQANGITFRTQEVTLESQVIYTVRFLGKDGNVLKTEQVVKGQAATASKAPEIEGFIFKGWDQEFTNIQSDLDVKAVYEEKIPEVDKAELEAVIAEADKITDESKYTADTWKLFTEMRDTAKEVLKNAQADQTQVDKAKEDLQKAMDRLMLKLPFEDVEGTEWFGDQVRYVYENKIMTGLDETIFGPYVTLARSHFVVMLYRMEGSPKVVYSGKYDDVANGEWYTDAVMWATEAGVVTGYTNSGLFGPADAITREQMAAMIYRYAAYKGYDTAQKADLSKFEDGWKVSEFAQEAMEWAVGSGIIEGKFEGTQLDPYADTARAEAAVILERFMRKIK